MPDNDGACPDCGHHVDLHTPNGCPICGCRQTHNPEDQ